MHSAFPGKWERRMVGERAGGWGRKESLFALISSFLLILTSYPSPPRESSFISTTLLLYSFHIPLCFRI